MECRRLPRYGIVVVALLVALAGQQVAFAGGVSFTLDAPPDDPEAGKPFTVGFMIHSLHDAKMAMPGLEPILVFTNAATDEQVTVTATADGTPGHYVASATLPSSGAWRWKLQPFGEEEGYSLPLQAFQVHDAGEQPAPAKDAPARATFAAQAIDSLFEPREIGIEAGTTVTWKNTGKLPHAVTSIDESFVSGAIAPGESYSFTFTEPGAFTYYCEYHAQKPAASVADDVVLISSAGGGGGHMVGTIRVTAAKEPAKEAAVEPATSLLAQAAVEPAEGAAVNGAATQSALPAAGTGASPWIAAALVAPVIVALGIVLRRRRLNA